MPDRDTGSVDSTREEVEHVVELVLTHALLRPDETLAVITVTSTHAEAVREAVLSEVRGNPALAAFFDSGRVDPFVVTDLPNVAGLRREAIILSLGLGRTPHRRVLHTFGPISAPGGDALLLDALGSTRHRLTLVACFGSDDLDPERLRGPGPRLLADLLAFAARRGAGHDVADLVTPPEPTDPLLRSLSAAAAAADEALAAAAQPDRLLLDLAERLWKHGLLVEADHGIPGGDRIPLVVGHPDLPGEMLVAVLTDDAEYTAEPSVRVRDRLTADRLERVGWSVIRVWSAAAFMDPQAEVDRIRRAVHARVPAPAPPRSAPLQLGLLDEADDAEELPTPESSAARAAARASAHPNEPRPATGVWSTVEVIEAADADPTDVGPAAAEPVDAPVDEPTEEPPSRALQLALAVPTRQRPDVRRGLPIGAYSDDQLDELVTWLQSDEQERTREQLAAALRDELGITRRSYRIDTAVRSAITRAMR
nr:hypothetical protein [Cellulomonas humilata]